MFKLIAIALTVAVSASQARPVRDSTLSEANNQLGLSLLKTLQDDHNNVFFSPLSISTAFAMLYSGAKGTTAQQMRQVLGYESVHLSDNEIPKQFSEVLRNLKNMELEDSHNSLNVANKLVIQKDFDVLESFEDNLRENFQSSVDSVDFADNAVIDQINQWVRSETKDKIQKLLDGPFDPNTKMVLLNAIYFKGVFQTMFDQKKTTEETFFTVDSQQIVTKMMKRNGYFNFTELPEVDASLLEIPYSGDEISLYVVLPNERQGLKRITEDIEDWTQIENGINNLQQRKVDVVIPKFKVETSYSLKDKLSRMGMESVFTSDADLSAIDGQKDLVVSKAMHKAFIEVNEEGTEAAAATGIVMQPMAILDPMIPDFRADHPFVFFIRDNTNGMNLFVGQINRL